VPFNVKNAWSLSAASLARRARRDRFAWVAETPAQANLPGEADQAAVAKRHGMVMRKGAAIPPASAAAAGAPIGRSVRTPTDRVNDAVRIHDGPQAVRPLRYYCSAQRTSDVLIGSLSFGTCDSGPWSGVGRCGCCRGTADSHSHCSTPSASEVIRRGSRLCWRSTSIAETSSVAFSGRLTIDTAAAGNGFVISMVLRSATQSG